MSALAAELTWIADREGDIYDLFVEAPCPPEDGEGTLPGFIDPRSVEENPPERPPCSLAICQILPDWLPPWRDQGSVVTFVGPKSKPCNATSPPS